MTGGAAVSAGLVAAVAEAVVVEAAEPEAGVETRLDFVLLWHSAGIVAVAARRRKRTGRSFILFTSWSKER
jgi:hypothetical protein